MVKISGWCHPNIQTIYKKVKYGGSLLGAWAIYMALSKCLGSIPTKHHVHGSMAMSKERGPETNPIRFGDLKNRSAYVPGSKVAIWEMVILPSKGNPYGHTSTLLMGWWPSLPWENNGSLDPSTYHGTPLSIRSPGLHPWGQHSSTPRINSRGWGNKLTRFYHWFIGPWKSKTIIPW